MIVEDDQLIRSLLVEVFGEADFEVLEADCGHSAKAILKQRPDIDLLLTDYLMPGATNGLKLAEHVRQLNPSCSIVITSGADCVLPETLGARSVFVSKPYVSYQVLALARKLMSISGTSPPT